ncbi:hypothetical protein DF186_25855, partial [Enterococcus hirae]
ENILENIPENTQKDILMKVVALEQNIIILKIVILALKNISTQIHAKLIPIPIVNTMEVVTAKESLETKDNLETKAT